MSMNPLRSGRARRFALTAAVLVIAATAAVMIWRPFSADAGPLVIAGGLPVDEGAIEHGFKVDVGDQFLWGYNMVKNTGEKPVRLRSVRMLPESSSSPVVDAKARKPGAGGKASVALGLWPLSRNEVPPTQNVLQESDLTPLAGYTILGGQEADIFVIMEMRETGRVDWDRIRLAYEVDGKEYVVEATNYLSVCTPRSVASCPPKRSRS
jgi:hypothetical protein